MDLASLVSQVRSRLGESGGVVAVDGLGGAGKSTLATALATELGAVVIHTDDFASWDVPLEWWPRVLAEVLEPLSEGRLARFQRYDWDRRELAEWHEVAPGGVVVLEGVSSSRVAFRPFLAFTVWVETPRALRLERGLERDGADAQPLWEGWMAAEDDWVEREHPRDSADYLVDGTV
jgi:uridine kinase